MPSLDRHFYLGLFLPGTRFSLLWPWVGWGLPAHIPCILGGSAHTWDTPHTLCLALARVPPYPSIAAPPLSPCRLLSPAPFLPPPRPCPPHCVSPSPCLPAHPHPLLVIPLGRSCPLPPLWWLYLPLPWIAVLAPFDPSPCLVHVATHIPHLAHCTHVGPPLTFTFTLFLYCLPLRSCLVVGPFWFLYYLPLPLPPRFSSPWLHVVYLVVVGSWFPFGLLPFAPNFPHVFVPCIRCVPFALLPLPCCMPRFALYYRRFCTLYVFLPAPPPPTHRYCQRLVGTYPHYLMATAAVVCALP